MASKGASLKLKLGTPPVDGKVSIHCEQSAGSCEHHKTCNRHSLSRVCYWNCKLQRRPIVRCADYGPKGLDTIDGQAGFPGEHRHGVRLIAKRSSPLLA
jgi:hypothetical protein